MPTAPATFALSLISHTNVGKTTLARTLLRRDIGEVRDAAHVTEAAERHVLLELPSGERLELWDTPGLGDSVRLAKRLAGLSNPIGWFLSEIWDRFRDRPFWSSQRAIRNVLDHADIVLYLVNASESPADVGYLDAELTVLSLLNKPVIVLLNQMGPPQGAAHERADIERWRARTRAAPCVHAVLALDAFARCWIQEDVLLEAVRDILPATRRAAFESLRTAWSQRNRDVWHASMRILAERVARAVLDREVVPAEGWAGVVRAIGGLLGLRREGSASPREHAMQLLAERLDASVRDSTQQLIRLHGLEGEATGVVLARLAEHYAERAPVSEGKAAMWGSVVAGALAGLKADLMAGGMTLGAGLLAGGVLGALGAAGLARGYNLVRGVDSTTLSWSDAVLHELVRSALLAYLAVAHYGRGRGNWVEAESPAFWRDQVDAAIAAAREPVSDVLKKRARGDTPTGATEPFVDALQAWFTASSHEILAQLYPAAQP